MSKPQFKTGNVGVEFINDSQVANRDTDVLPAMVNADIEEQKRDKTVTTSG